MALESRKKFGREMRGEFLFEEGWRNLNHGAFGTYPRAIQTAMRSFQDQYEARPDDFIRYSYPLLLDEARQAMSKLLHVPTNELVFVPNATTGIGTVLHNLTYTPTDHILFFATVYGAVEKAVAHITETTPAKAAKIAYTYPVEDDWLVSALRDKVREIESQGGRVKLAIFDTVVSMPGVRMPFEQLAAACKELGVISMVDGAHGVGHVELDLGALGADFFVSNCHKWLHTPRGTAIFHVPLRNQALIRSTLPTSHGFQHTPLAPFGPARNPLPAIGGPKSLFEQNFEFVGTIDPSPYLTVPAALAWREKVCGGEDAIRRYCEELAREGGRKVAGMLGTRVLENGTGTLGGCCMVNVALPVDGARVHDVGVKAGVEREDVGTRVRDWMGEVLVKDYDTFMQTMFYAGEWWVRLSAQVYLELEDFVWAGETLKRVCKRVESGEWVGVKSKL